MRHVKEARSRRKKKKTQQIQRQYLAWHLQRAGASPTCCYCSFLGSNLTPVLLLLSGSSSAENIFCSVAVEHLRVLVTALIWGAVIMGRLSAQCEDCYFDRTSEPRTQVTRWRKKLLKRRNKPGLCLTFVFTAALINVEIKSRLVLLLRFSKNVNNNKPYKDTWYYWYNHQCVTMILRLGGWGKI